MTELPDLREQDVDPDPIRQFAAWFAQAGRAGEPAPEAAAIATTTPDGAPSVRMVLVKQADTTGFVFYTNYESDKGRDLAANPRAALLFHWKSLARQVRVQGPAQRTSAAESAAYIRTRDRGSQLSALASPQSRPVPSRGDLEQRVAELGAHYGDGELPIPDHWGGFRIVPRSIEFWQGRPDRLHDRLRYSLGPDGGWQLARLAP